MPEEPTDKELLDALEAFINKEPLVLWDGVGVYRGGRLSGLSALNGRRTLRQMLAVLVPKKPC